GIVAEQAVGHETERVAVVDEAVGEADRAGAVRDVQRVLVGADHADLDRGDPGCDLVAVVVGREARLIAEPLARFGRRPHAAAEGLGEPVGVARALNAASMPSSGTRASMRAPAGST